VKFGGFSLIELVAVIAIIGIIVALTAPGLSRAKVTGQRGACIANTRTIQTLNLVGVPVVYPIDYEWPFWSPFEGKTGYSELKYPRGQREMVLFVNCFDCHDRTDPFEPVHEFITVW